MYLYIQLVDMFFLITGFGLHVHYLRQWPSAVYIWLNGTYRGQLEGICGNCSGDPFDDRFPRGLNMPGTDVEIGDSWIVHTIYEE